MQIVFDVGIILLAYLLGSVPFGLLIVKLKTGKWKPADLLSTCR